MTAGRRMSYLDVYAERGRLQAGWESGRSGMRADVEAVKDAYTIHSHVSGEWHRPTVELATAAHVTDAGTTLLWLDVPGGEGDYQRIREAFRECGLLADGTGIDEPGRVRSSGRRHLLHSRHSLVTRDDTRFWETFKVLAADSVLTFDALLETTRELVPVRHREEAPDLASGVPWPIPLRDGEVLVSPSDPREDSDEVLLVQSLVEVGPYRRLLGALKDGHVLTTSIRGGRPETASVVHRMGAELPPF